MSGPIKVVKTKLFIGNLDQATQPGELSELFSSFGTVLEASVIKDYGFVHYGSIEEAEKAVSALNNKEFHGKRLRVELSTSTVRHRPGQPEPASALRHSRARGARGNSNGVSRYGPAGVSGGGPMRHNASAWARNDTRPYDRSRPYDIRPDARRYYEDTRDNGYGTEYDGSAYTSNSDNGQAGTNPYHDVPPHSRSDGYGLNRPYDRHLSAPPVDPYYGGGLPQGPPPGVDPYQNYDPYQKYYASRPRDPEFPGQRDYDLYTNYRNDAYGIVNNQEPIRHDISMNLPQSQGVYPSSHRQHPTYTGGSSNLAQYYGAQQH